MYTVSALSGSPYYRLLGLRSASERALRRGDLKDAEILAKNLLELAERYRSSWYYGNAFHNGHELLGLAHLKRGNTVEAERELLESGQTPGSPQLNSFGPNLTLARDLLRQGRRDGEPTRHHPLDIAIDGVRRPVQHDRGDGTGIGLECREDNNQLAISVDCP